jgi:hypothetical protein
MYICISITTNGINVIRQLINIKEKPSILHNTITISDTSPPMDKHLHTSTTASDNNNISHRHRPRSTTTSTTNRETIKTSRRHYFLLPSILPFYLVFMTCKIGFGDYYELRRWGGGGGLLAPQLMLCPTCTFCLSLAPVAGSTLGGRILGRNWDKSLWSFPLCFALRFLFIQTHATSYSFCS